jgi:hypothetical protein
VGNLDGGRFWFHYNLLIRFSSPQFIRIDEQFSDFEPVADAGVAGDGDVVGGVVEDAGAVEAFELAGVVVDEVVGAEDGLVAAEDDVGVGDGGEVALEPSMAAEAMKTS